MKEPPSVFGLEKQGDLLHSIDTKIRKLRQSSCASDFPFSLYSTVYGLQ